MNDAPDANTEVPEGKRAAVSYIRLPWYMVTAALVILLGGLLALGLYANRNSRPQPVAAPTQATDLVATATLVPTQAVSSTPLVVIPSTPTKAVVASTATALPSAISTAPAPSPTSDPALVAEVSQAFDRYWEIRAQALLELDTTHLPEVMGGDHLRVIAQRVDELRSQNRAIKTDIDHEIHVINVNTYSARIVDDYISNSVYVDPVTRDLLSEPTSDELRVLYQLDKSDGTWKVVDSVQAD